MPTCVELFAGGGGASLGLQRAGFRSVRQVEWDPDACATLRAAGFEDVVEGDVRTVSFDGIGSIDLLWASPPCQAFSTSGKRFGALDDRNGWPWTLEAIDRLRQSGSGPTWVLCENVPGILHHVDGCSREVDPTTCAGCYWERAVITGFQERYACVSWRVLDAADYGAPQCRHRVILAAGPSPFPWPKESHSALNLIYDKWVGTGYWVKHGMQRPSRGPTLADSRHMGIRLAVSSGRPDVGKLPYVTVRDTLGLKYPIRHQSPTAHTIQHLPDDVAPTILGKGTLYAERHIQKGSFNPHYHTEQPSGGVLDIFGDSEECEDTSGVVDAVIEAKGRRRLTSAECSALQGFPVGYPWQGLSTSQYKQVGNAVAPPVAEALGRAVLGALRG